MVDLFITIGLSLLFLCTILGTKSIFVGLIVLTVVFFGIFFFIRTPASFLFFARTIVRKYLWEKHRYRIISAGLLGMIFLTPAIGFPATAVLMCSIVGLVLHWQSAVFFGIAGGFLVTAPFFLSVREETLAESSALLSYYFLCLGVVWEGISQVVHAAFPNVSFRFAKPRVPHISLPTLPTIVVEVPNMPPLPNFVQVKPRITVPSISFFLPKVRLPSKPHISFPTIVVEKPHVSMPSFSFKVPRIPTIHHSYGAIPTRVIAEPVTLTKKQISLFQRLKLFMEAFLDMTDMSRLYRRIPGYRTAQQLHMALSRPLFIFSIPTRQSMYGMVEKGKKQIALLWKKSDVPVSVIAAQSGEQLTLSFSSHESSELSATPPIPVVATVQKTVQSETPSPPIARSMSELSPRSNRLRMVTVETEDIGPMAHFPHITIPNISLPTWDEWKHLLYRWQKTKLVWPSFRIRFILPTIRIPEMYYKPTQRVSFVPSVVSEEMMSDEHMQVMKAYKNVQMKQRFPKFQVKIRLPYGFQWPSVLTPTKPSVQGTAMKKKSVGVHLPVVRVKVSAPSCALRAQKTAVQKTETIQTALVGSLQRAQKRLLVWNSLVKSIPGAVHYFIEYRVVCITTACLHGYASFCRQKNHIYQWAQRMSNTSVTRIKHVKMYCVSTIRHFFGVIRTTIQRISHGKTVMDNFFLGFTNRVVSHGKTNGGLMKKPLSQIRMPAFSLPTISLPSIDVSSYRQTVETRFRSLTAFVLRLNRTWSYSVRIVLPTQKKKTHAPEVHILEDLFSLLPSVASEKSIPSLNLFQKNVPFFERVEDMLATLPVFAPSDRIPSVNLFRKSSKNQSLSFGGIALSSSLPSWMTYAVLGSAFLCGILFNMMR